jgi:HlyD family secretion protein
MRGPVGLRGRTVANPKRVLLLVSQVWLLSVALGLLSICGCKKETDTADATEVSVQVEKPEQGDISERIMADATLSPLAQAAISPKITAPVRRFYVQRGSHVKSGQLLATLENSDLVAAALDNKGSYTAAQATFNAQTQAQVPEDYQKAELDVAQTKATLDLNQSIVNARQQLFTQGAIPGRDLDTAMAGLVQAKAAYDTASKHLQSLQTVSRQAALEQAQGQLTSAKGKYAGAEAQVSYSEIRSPIDGVVTDRALFAGETAAAGSSLITVMDTSALLAKVHLSQIVAQRLKVGDDAMVTVEGITDPIPAKISLISPALDPGSTTVEIWLRVDNRKGVLKAGAPARASIVGRTVPGAIKIPVSAVLTAENGSKSVMTVGSDGAAHRKSIKLGIQDGGDVQVISGLEMSDTVISEGAYGLDDGTKVKVGAAKEDDDKSSAGKGEDSK